MILDERNCREEAILEASRAIMTAGRTAPKGKGLDLIEIITLIGDDLHTLAEAMRRTSEETGLKFLIRDAENIDASLAVILVGTRSQTMSLNCGYCGYANCAEKNLHPEVPCALNSVDVGIALGSMAAKAADLRLDTRIMFSAGYTAQKLGLMNGCRQILAMPLSISSKSPFFDRTSTR